MSEKHRSDPGLPMPCGSDAPLRARRNSDGCALVQPANRQDTVCHVGLARFPAFNPAVALGIDMVRTGITGTTDQSRLVAPLPGPISTVSLVALHMQFSLSHTRTHAPMSRRACPASGCRSHSRYSLPPDAFSDCAHTPISTDTTGLCTRPFRHKNVIKQPPCAYPALPVASSSTGSGEHHADGTRSIPVDPSGVSHAC